MSGAAFAPCVSPLTLGPLAEGSYSLAVRAVDTAGNADPAPARRDFVVAATDSGPGSGPGRADLRILGKRLKINRRGVAKVRLRCIADAAAPSCFGRLTLRTRAKLRLGSGKKAKRRRVGIAKGRFEVAPGATERVKLKLRKPKLRLLRSKRRARTIVATARFRGAAGNPESARKKLRAAPKKKKKKKKGRAARRGRA